jgi:hypothetical protein
MLSFQDPQRRTDNRYVRNPYDVPARPTYSRRLTWRVIAGLSVLVLAGSVVFNGIMHILSWWDQSLF